MGILPGQHLFMYFSVSKFLEGGLSLPSTTLMQCIGDQQGCWEMMEEVDGGWMEKEGGSERCCERSD